MSYSKILNFSGRRSSDYEFLLPLVNTFTLDTDKYYPRCCRVNETKTFKNLVASFYTLCSQIICTAYCRLIDLTSAFNITLIYCCILFNLIRRLSNNVRSFLFAKGKKAFKIKLVNILSRSPRVLTKRTSAAMELSH